MRKGGQWLSRVGCVPPLRRLPSPALIARVRHHVQAVCQMSLSTDHDPTGHHYTLPDGTHVPTDDLRFSIPELWLSGDKHPEVCKCLVAAVTFFIAH